MRILSQILKSVFVVVCLLMMAVWNGCEQQPPTTLKVLQMNTWCEGAIVEGDGRRAVMKVVETTNPDIVLFQEVRGQKFIDEVIDYFKSRGITYYGHSLNISTAVMSKYPIHSVRSSEELGNDSYAFVKAVIGVGDRELTVYSMHLDWKHLAFYNLRGFDGHSDTRPYMSIEAATSVDDILAENNLSRRRDEVKVVLEDAAKELEKNRLVILGGDFNEPSCQDWGEDTRHLRDHRGLMIDWPCSSMLRKAGFVDTYRSVHSNAVTHPGFTCNAGVNEVTTKELCWALGVDDRERIDRIYYYPDERLCLIDACVVGPKEDFWDNKVRYEPTQDEIITPAGLWPSDHKAVLSVFQIR